MLLWIVIVISGVWAHLWKETMQGPLEADVFTVRNAFNFTNTSNFTIVHDYARDLLLLGIAEC